jgi:hypothetical protein
MLFFSISVVFLLPSTVAYLFHAASLHTSRNVGAITKRSCTGATVDPRMLLGPLPTHTLYHCIVMLKLLCTTDLPSSSSFNGVHNRGQRGDAHGWLVYSHPSQSIGEIANTVECQFCSVLLILWSLQASNSTTKGSYGLARLLLLVYNIEVVEKPFVLWRMDQIAILAMQNKMVSFVFFAESLIPQFAQRPIVYFGDLWPILVRSTNLRINKRNIMSMML